MSASTDDISAEQRESRDAVRQFALREVTPIAHKLHLAGAEIPDTVLAKMQHMGIFGVAAPVDLGGLGMGALGAPLVTEELSRAWMSAGSVPLYNWTLIQMLQN